MSKRFELYWEKRGIKPFSPIQEKVFSDKSLLVSSQNIVIISPTSSGKSIIIEYFISYTLSLGKKVIYLSPFKSILEERLRDFSYAVEFFEKTLIFSTHEFFERDKEVLKGEYSLLLTVYEKLGYFLQKRNDFLKDVGLLVLDELSILEDNTRGPYIDVLVSYARKKGVRILGVTSFIFSQKNLSDYLDAKIISSDERPTPIRMGYLKEGIFYWKDKDGYRKERLLEGDYLPDEEFFLLLERLWRDEGAIVFFSTRAKARRAFSYMAERLPEIHTYIDTSALPHTLFSEEVKRYVMRGVGYHSRDLTYPERQFIENLIYDGKIKLLFATTTVALGVNFPFRNVVFPEVPPVSLGIFKNMIGRAARGRRFPYGRAIFFSKSDIPDEKSPTPFSFRFRNRFEEYTFLLRRVVFGVREDELYLSYESNSYDQSGLLFLREKGLLKQEEGREVPTLLGILVASTGIDLSSFIKIREILESPFDGSLEEFIYRFLEIEALREFYLDPASYRDAFSWWAEAAGYLSLPPVGSLTKKELDYIRKTLIVLGIINNLELIDIEKRYKVSAGIVTEFFDRFTWVVGIAHRMLDYIQVTYDIMENVNKLKEAVSKTEDREYLLFIDDSRPDSVIFDGKRIELTYRQFELLKLLAGRAGKVVTYEEIMSHIWKDNYDVSLKQISYHKRKISQKLGREIIKAVKGRGLYLDLLPSEVGIC